MKTKQKDIMRILVTLIALVGLATLGYISYQGRYGTSIYPHMSLRSLCNWSHQINNKANRTCFHPYFENIILIIVYNYPQYDSISNLRQLYQPVFPMIFICGPKANASTFNVTQLSINRGIFGYGCLSEAIRQHPGHEGYFYINDDVILNYWNLVDSKFNKSFIWESNNQFGRIDLKEIIKQPWYWWVSPYGFNNTKDAVKELRFFAKNYKKYRDMFSLYQENGDGNYYAYSGRSDIVYIPRKYAMGFQELSQIFFKHKVFLEIAMPTILRFLAPTSEIFTLLGHYIPGDVRKKDYRVIDSRYFWNTYFKNLNLWFIHPFKLHHEGHNNRDLNLALLEHILIRKGKDFANCK